MRILIATAGSRGDVEPFAALARRAIAEGHDVRLVAPENSGADLSGIDFASMGVDYSAMIEDQGVSIAAAIRSYRTVVRPIMNAVIVESAQLALDFEPDVVVAHPKILSAPLVADALGIPWVIAEIVPAMTPTRAFPAAGTATRDLGALNRVTYRAAAASAGMFRSDLDEVARLVGTNRKNSPPPSATVMPISPAILARPEDWPSTVHLTGPWRDDTHSELMPDEVASFIENGDFVYAGFGSMAAGDPVERARHVLRGIHDYGARALIATGLGGMDVPRELRGDDTLVVKSLPHDTVLPRALAAIHHGGIGSVQAATRAGTASVIVPFIADQPFWGARLHARGLSPAPIPSKQLSTKRLATALNDSAHYNDAVSAASATMKTEDGAGVAMGVIVGVS